MSGAWKYQPLVEAHAASIIRLEQHTGNRVRMRQIAASNEQRNRYNETNTMPTDGDRSHDRWKEDEVCCYDIIQWRPRQWQG